MDNKRGGRDSNEPPHDSHSSQHQSRHKSESDQQQTGSSSVQQLSTSSDSTQHPTAAPAHGSRFATSAGAASNTPRNSREMMTGSGGRGRGGGGAGAATLLFAGPNRGDSAGGIERNKRESEGGAQDEMDSRAGKKTRVEGRGSSAAQRAAASEACKGITLEALQAQYYRPLSDVAKDLRVSVARLLKKCREFGILRWPYRHVRSVQESIEQLERDREAATDQLAAEEMDLRLRLLRRRGELVIHFASCGLESDMRKGIFLADPRDVDAMIAKAHEAYGRRRPPHGWDALGQFPDLMIREHFLEQMRAHMVGGGGMLSAPDSPHERGGHLHEDPMGAVGEMRDPLHHPQHPSHHQMYRQEPSHGRSHGQWQHPQQQPSQHSWQGRSAYPRGDPEQARQSYPSPYWGPGSSVSAGFPSAGGGASRGMSSSAGGLGRIRSPGRADYPPTSESVSAGYPFVSEHASSSSAHTSLGQPPPQQQPHHPHEAVPSGTSPSLRPLHGGSGPQGSTYHSSLRPAMQQRGDRRETGAPEGWGSAAGGGSEQHPDERAGPGSRHPMWRHPGRLTPPPPHLGSASARRGWGSIDLASPSERGMPPGATALPSIFERQGHLDRPPSNFLPSTAAGGPPSAGGAGVSTNPRSGSRIPGGIGEGQAVGIASLGGAGSAVGPEAGSPRESQWASSFHQPPPGGFDHRWGLSQALDRRPPGRRSEGLTPPGISRGGGGGGSVGGEQGRSRGDPSSSTPPRSPGSRFVGDPGPGTGGPSGAEQPNLPRDPPWNVGRAPAVAASEGFDRRGGYGPQGGGGHRAPGGEGAREGGSPPQQHGQEGGGSGGSRRTSY